MSSENVPLYEYSIAIFLNTMKNLAYVLNKAEQHAKDKGEDVEKYTKLKIHPDMRDFTFQIFRAVSAATSAFTEISSRASSIDRSTIEMPDAEYTWSELKTRLNQTIEFFEQNAKPEDFAGQDEKELVLYGGAFKLKPQYYLQRITLPNFFFHVTTAYDILRAEGVPLSKIDYLLGADGDRFRQQQPPPAKA